jgi:hypothetical protein
MCKLSQESRLSFRSVLGESREEVVGVAPALFCLVEPAEFSEAVDLLRDGGLQVPVVVVISWEVLQVGFELLVFCETGSVVTVIRRNRDEVRARTMRSIPTACGSKRSMVAFMSSSLPCSPYQRQIVTQISDAVVQSSRRIAQSRSRASFSTSILS